MSTPCIAPGPLGYTPALPPQPWWRSWIAATARVLQRWPDLRDSSSWRRQDWLALRTLSPRTLRDIGAPDWIVHDAGQHERRAWDRLLG